MSESGKQKNSRTAEKLIEGKIDRQVYLANKQELRRNTREIKQTSIFFFFFFSFFFFFFSFFFSVVGVRIALHEI